MGMTYDELEKIKEIKHGLIKDLIEYGNKDGKLNEIDTLAHAIKNICKIIEDSEMSVEGYSGRRYSGDHMMREYPYEWSGNMRYAPMIYDGYSDRRGRGPGAARDSMGRFSSHGTLASELYSIMNNTQNDMERRELQNLINKLESNN